jgi:hypothetical protein
LQLATIWSMAASLASEIMGYFSEVTLEQFVVSALFLWMSGSRATTCS